MTTDELYDLHGRLVREQQWLEEQWRATDDDTQVVVELLRLWVQGSAVAAELKRRLSGCPAT